MVGVSFKLFQSFKRKSGSFIDSVYIYARGGTGGNGLPQYGGVGGKGGDVYVKAVNYLTLKNTVNEQPNKRFIADTGESSKKYRILGRPGKDLIIKVPTGITVIDKTKRVLGDLNNPDDTLLIAKGGCGGSKENTYFGQKGEARCVTLDLKLIADIGFVGFPNAGKSTLLKALSRASPKIANYPFTTIKPNVGMMAYEDNRQIMLADLPGLIEGAHVNFGMGHKFLKHVIRTKLLLFVVDVSGFQLTSSKKYDYPYRTAFETLMLLNKELELYKEELTDKPAILAVNKVDNETKREEFEILLDKLKHLNDYINDLPEEIRPLKVLEFDDIIPISAKTAYNIEKLKNRIRTVLDFHWEKEQALNEVDSSDIYREETEVLKLV